MIVRVTWKRNIGRDMVVMQLIRGVMDAVIWE